MDPKLQRIALVALGLIALAVIIGAIVLALDGTTVPGELWAIAGAAVGAIAGIVTGQSIQVQLPQQGLLVPQQPAGADAEVVQPSRRRRSTPAAEPGTQV